MSTQNPGFKDKVQERFQKCDEWVEKAQKSGQTTPGEQETESHKPHTLEGIDRIIQNIKGREGRMKGLEETSSNIKDEIAAHDMELIDDIYEATAEGKFKFSTARLERKVILEMEQRLRDLKGSMMEPPHLTGW